VIRLSRIFVRGGQRLSGKVKINGAKNAVLPIIAASILASEGVSIIHEASNLDDVRTMHQVLVGLGITITYDHSTIRVDASHIQCSEASYDLVRRMRASFLIMGPLLARCGEVRIDLPGGCAIGTRHIDQHLKGFVALGV
jgi:UDP-N-acetylglucosamine 1-carboxyvinyltransferase